MKRNEGIFYTHSELGAKHKSLLCAKLTVKQTEDDEIPKEHLNDLGHNTQHILDVYNSAPETLHVPIFVQRYSAPPALSYTDQKHRQVTETLNTAHCLVNNLTIRIQLSDTE